MRVEGLYTDDEKLAFSDFLNMPKISELYANACFLRRNGAPCLTHWQHEDWVKSGESSIITDTYNTDWLRSEDVINSSITGCISATVVRTAGHSLCRFSCHMHHTDQTVGGCEGHFSVSEADVSVDTMPLERSQFVVKRAVVVRAEQGSTAQRRAARNWVEF